MKKDFDRLYFGLAVAVIIGLCCLVYVSFFNLELFSTEIGIILMAAPLVAIIRNILLASTDEKNILGLYSAFIAGKLKEYDLGSRFLTYSLLTSQIIGLCLILFDSF